MYREEKQMAEEKFRFNNDYNHGAHPQILKMLVATNSESYCGYCEDEWCEAASNEIKKYIDCPDAAIYYIGGGTTANSIMIEAMLSRPFYGIICPDTGHVAEHETGAIEHKGHKLHQLPAKNGKINAEQIKEEVLKYHDSPMQVHVTEPKMVYISFPTEFGTIYSKAELEAIRAVCDEYNLLMYIDGARLGYGLGSSKCDVTIKDITRLADAYYIGGTKCGTLFGEAIVITNKAIDFEIRKYFKMNGALLAKGWLLGIQFYTLFKEGLYFKITKEAVKYAEVLQKIFDIKEIPEYIPSDSNQLFYIMHNDDLAKIDEGFIYDFVDKYDEEHSIVRFCTSWSSTKEEVFALANAIKVL